MELNWLGPVAMLAGVVELKVPVQESTVNMETLLPVNAYANSSVVAGTHATGVGGVGLGLAIWIECPPQPTASTANTIKITVCEHLAAKWNLHLIAG
jgi:hypothetical protein